MLPLYVIVCIEQTALPQLCYLFRLLLSWISCQHHRNHFLKHQPNQCTYVETVTLQKTGKSSDHNLYKPLWQVTIQCIKDTAG